MSRMEHQTLRGHASKIIIAVEAKDFPRLDSYHWYGPDFTNFAGKGQRLARRRGRAQGLEGLNQIRLLCVF